MREELLDRLWTTIIDPQWDPATSDKIQTHCKRFPYARFSEQGEAIARILAAGSPRRIWPRSTAQRLYDAARARGTPSASRVSKAMMCSSSTKRSACHRPRSGNRPPRLLLPNETAAARQTYWSTDET